MRRKLLARRGRLHAFPVLAPTRSAVVVVDATAGFTRSVPNGAASLAAINALTAAARAAGSMVAWIRPTPPAAWPSAAAAIALLGAGQADRQARDRAQDRPDARLDPGLALAAGDRHHDKRGYSAFHPGNCAIVADLAERGIDTVILAGFLTDICVEASARDAFEAGFRVLLCADACAADDPASHHRSLQVLARAYADVRPVAEIAELLARAAPAS